MQTATAPTVAQGRTTASGGAPPAQALIPFTRGSIEHTEPTNVRSSVQLSTNAVQVGPAALPAYGYLACLYVLVVASGGVAGNATVAYQLDAPFSALSELRLQDINGNPLIQVSGYEAALITTFGGYDFNPALNVNPAWTAPTANGNFSYLLKVPVQLRQRDALAAIPNMNAASAYQFNYTQAAAGDIYTTAPDTLPTLTVTSWIGAWGQPAAQSATGAPQAQNPPALGTTQYWSRQAGVAIAEGGNNVLLNRVGNLIRNIILIARDPSGVRTDDSLLSPYQLKWDSRTILDETVGLRRNIMATRFSSPGIVPSNPITYPPGVLVIDFTHSFTGHPGDGDLADLWYPTASSSRLEFQGTAAAAGSLTILVNDVIPAGDVYGMG